jgi:predicted MFS family arabinose efflux permease
MTDKNRNTEPGHLSAAERRTVAVVGAVYGVRMLGLFMLLPVLALYAEGLQNATLFLAGIAVGAYGLTQALLQIPVGVLSDRYGRVPVIVIGLAIFACGSVVAAMSTTIGGVIAGRALQGAGAIAAALTALLADATRDELRTRAMAVIGMCIGGSFVVSLVAGAPLAALIGVSGLFWMTAALAVGAMLLVLTALPAEARAAQAKARLSLAGLRRVIREPRLLELDAGIFILHLILTATFTAVPFLLRDEAGVAQEHQWRIFLGAIVVSLAGTVPLVLWTERGARPRRPFTTAVGALAGALLLLTAAPPSLAVAAAALTVFFAAFNFLEARLPARLAGLAPADARGAALGVYASAQFLGVFAGGALGGWLLERYGPAGVFLLGAAAATVWTASQIRESGR